jgi:hypothetical protein
MRSRAERPRRSSPAGASSNSSGGEILSSSLRYSLGIGSPSSNAREVSLKAAADRSSPISLATSTDTSAPVKERPRIARSLCTDTLLLLLRSGSKRKRPPASAGVSAAGREASRGTAPVRRCALRALNVGRLPAVRLFDRFEASRVARGKHVHMHNQCRRRPGHRLVPLVYPQVLLGVARHTPCASS